MNSDKDSIVEQYRHAQRTRDGALHYAKVEFDKSIYFAEKDFDAREYDLIKLCHTEGLIDKFGRSPWDAGYGSGVNKRQWWLRRARRNE